MVLICACMGAWFAYDGFIGWPVKNFQEHLAQLPTEQREDAKHSTVYPSVKPENLAGAQQAIRKIGRKKKREALERLFGGPPSYQNENAWYYFGPVFRVKLSIKNGAIRSAEGQATEKTLSDLQLQKGIAALLGIASMGFLVQFIRIVRTRLVVDEEGLCFRRRRRIAWQDILALSANQFERKGWVDLVCRSGGREQRLRLDEYHLDKFEQVVARICATRGFGNPIELERAKKRAQAAAASGEAS